MNISRSRRTILAIAAATLLTTACSTTASYPTRETARRGAATQVLVKNHNWMDMAIYAIRGNTRVRIGTVTSGTTERLRLPHSLNLSAAALRLEANPIGSDEAFVSEPIRAETGVVVNWTIENHIAISSYYITSR